MAKRFTDTAKWDKPWFRKLPCRLKTAFEFLRDKCDAAGVWEIDLEALAFNVGEPVSLEEIRTHFKARELGDNKLWLTEFITFQYGHLSEHCKPHIPVINRLKKLNLWKGYSKGLETLEEKEKDQDQEKDQEKEKEKEPDLIAIWNGCAGPVFPHIHKLTESRRRSWRSRWAEKPDEEYWRSVIARMRKSPFCCGETSTWKANVDFFLRPDTAIKVMEGAYDAKPGSNAKQPRSITEMIAAGEVEG